MKTYAGNRALARFTKLLLDMMFWSGAALTLSLPWTFRWAARFYPNLDTYYVLYVAVFMLSGAAAVLIMRELRRMFKTVLADDCFVRANVVSLRRMGCLGLVIAVVTAVRLIVIFTPATVVIILVFSIAALFSFVLAGVFDRAVSYKLENDLTI